MPDKRDGHIRRVPVKSPLSHLKTWYKRCMSVKHGNIDVKVQGSIIVTKYVGQFNSAGLLDELAKLQAAIDGLNGAPFAILVDDLELEGGTPGAYEALNTFNLGLADLPLVAKATVIQSNLKLKIIDSRVTARQQQNHRAFTDRDEAMAWLQSELDTYR